MVNLSDEFSQLVTNCSLFSVSKYLDSRPAQDDKAEQCQIHDFYLEGWYFGIPRVAYLLIQDQNSVRYEFRIICCPLSQVNRFHSNEVLQQNFYEILNSLASNCLMSVLEAYVAEFVAIRLYNYIF